MTLSRRNQLKTDQPVPMRHTRRAASGWPCVRDVISDARTAPWFGDIRSPRPSLFGSRDGAGRAPHGRALARAAVRGLRVHSRLPTVRKLHNPRASSPTHFPRVLARMRSPRHALRAARVPRGRHDRFPLAERRQSTFRTVSAHASPRHVARKYERHRTALIHPR